MTPMCADTHTHTNVIIINGVCTYTNLFVCMCVHCVCMRQRTMEGLTLSSSPSSSPSAPLLLLSTAGNHADLCCRKQPSLIRYSLSRSSGRSSISIRHSRPMRALSDPKTEESSLPDEEQAVNESEIEKGVSSSLIDKNISQV